MFILADTIVSMARKKGGGFFKYKEDKVMVTIPHLLITWPLPPLITHIQSIPHCFAILDFWEAFSLQRNIYLFIDPFKALGMYKA